MQGLLRRLTLFLSAVLALAVTMLTVTPASAAPSRSTTNTNTVIFVHGIQGDPTKTGHDCRATWSAARNHFADKGWRGSLLTFGYYAGDTNCSHEFGGNRDTPIQDVAKAFANYVYDNFSKPSKGSKKIDVVAHSMGGLVVRAALYHTGRGTAGFPDGPIYIEDVATLATPTAAAPTTASAGSCGSSARTCGREARSSTCSRAPCPTPAMVLVLTGPPCRPSTTATCRSPPVSQVPRSTRSSTTTTGLVT